jgi:hypothetical protein
MVELAWRSCHSVRRMRRVSHWPDPRSSLFIRLSAAWTSVKNGHRFRAEAEISPVVLVISCLLETLSDGVDLGVEVLLIAAHDHLSALPVVAALPHRPPILQAPALLRQ